MIGARSVTAPKAAEKKIQETLDFVCADQQVNHTLPT